MSSVKPYDELIIQENNYEVEFSNCGNRPKKHSFEKTEHVVDWLGRLIPPGYTREQCLRYAPEHRFYTELLIRTWANKDKERLKTVDDFFSDIMGSVVGKIPDSSALQRTLEGKQRPEEKNPKFTKIRSPDDIIKLVNETIELHFPERKFKGIFLDGGIISKRSKRAGILAGVQLKDIPIRVVAALQSIAFICEEANQGDMWYACLYRDGKGYKRTGCVMSFGWYLYMRYTDFSTQIIRRCLQTSAVIRLKP